MRNEKGQFIKGNQQRLGIKHTTESKIKMGQSRKGKHNSPNTEFKKGICPKTSWQKGHIPWNKYKNGCFSIDTRNKMSKAKTGKPPWNKGLKDWNAREKHHNWQGGKSFEPYTTEWTDDLRESIRKRDNYTCQICGKSQNELIGMHKKLSVHHIDYNKKNLNPNNLITLCVKCHMKTDFKRSYWINYFKGLLGQFGRTE